MHGEGPRERVTTTRLKAWLPSGDNRLAGTHSACTDAGSQRESRAEPAYAVPRYVVAVRLRSTSLAIQSVSSCIANASAPSTTTELYSRRSS